MADERDELDEALWRLFADAAVQRRLLVAGRLADAGVLLADLPALLGCDPRTAWKVAACLPPLGPDNLDHWVGVVSGRFGLDPERVRRLAERLV